MQSDYCWVCTCISEQKSGDYDSFNPKTYNSFKKWIWFQYVLPRVNSASSTEEEKEKSVFGSGKFENSRETEVRDEDKEFCQLFCLPLSEVPLSGVTICSNRANFTLCVCVFVALLLEIYFDLSFKSAQTCFFFV